MSEESWRDGGGLTELLNFSMLEDAIENSLSVIWDIHELFEGVGLHGLSQFIFHSIKVFCD